MRASCLFYVAYIQFPEHVLRRNPLNATSVKFCCTRELCISLPCDLGGVLNGQEKWSIRAESMDVGLWAVEVLGSASGPCRRAHNSCCVSFLLKFDWEQLLGLIVGRLEPSDVFVFSRAACWVAQPVVSQLLLAFFESN